MSNVIGPDGLMDEERAWRDDAAYRWFPGIVATFDKLAAERLAHAETRAERDRLRAGLERHVCQHVECNPRETHAGCDARALLGEVKP